ncbi:MAG: SdrD B-like domain-containing protein [Candidatus Binatia bacterium]
MSSLLRGLPLLALTLALAPVAARAAEVGGTVFDDRNGDGAQGAGEPGLAGWVVYIDANANGLLDGDDTCTPQASEACVVTDDAGAFVFRNLPAGDVRLRILARLEGWRRTTEASLDVLLPTAASVVGDQRFGVFRLGAVTGTVFEDVDGNASRGDGEPPLVGWTPFIDADLDGALGPREPRGDSNAEGAY